MKLYEIADQYQQVLSEMYDPETGEVNETSLERINEIKESLEQKCIAVACYIENMEAERKAIEEAKKRMAEREAQFKKMVTNMKDYLRFNMEKSDTKKIVCTYFNISIAKNPPAVEIYDEKIVPLDYDRVKIEKDTAKIRADLMNGVSIPGARLIQRNSVRIR